MAAGTIASAAQKRLWLPSSGALPTSYTRKHRAPQIQTDTLPRRRGLTADDCAAILATAAIPRRTGRGLESETAAADRGAVGKAIVSLLFQGGLRRSEAAALRWADVRELSTPLT